MGWRWGHPDDWTDEEWKHAFSPEARVLGYALLLVGGAVVIYWAGVGF